MQRALQLATCVLFSTSNLTRICPAREKLRHVAAGQRGQFYSLGLVGSGQTALSTEVSSGRTIDLCGIAVTRPRRV